MRLKVNGLRQFELRKRHSRCCSFEAFFKINSDLKHLKFLHLKCLNVCVCVCLSLYNGVKFIDLIGLVSHKPFSSLGWIESGILGLKRGIYIYTS